jgi:hypothetical protein
MPTDWLSASPPTSSESEDDSEDGSDGSPGRHPSRKRPREEAQLATRRKPEGRGSNAGGGSKSPLGMGPACDQPLRVLLASPVRALPPFDPRAAAIATAAGHATQGREARSIDLPQAWSQHREQQQPQPQHHHQDAPALAAVAAAKPMKDHQQQPRQRAGSSASVEHAQVPLPQGCGWATCTAVAATAPGQQTWATAPAAATAATVATAVATAAAAAAAVPPATPTWPLQDAVAEAVAASKEGLCRGIALLASRRRLDRGRTETYL